jgi:hypothetical protein
MIRLLALRLMRLSPLLLAGSGLVASAAETQHFTGVAHDLKTGRVIYDEQYDVQSEGGRWLSGTTRYVSPSGQQFAERRFDFTLDRYVPIFSLDQSDPAYREGIDRIDKTKVDPYLVRDGERQTAAIDRTKDMVADCGAQAYIVDHLEELQAGQTLHFTLVVAGRLDSFKLRASKVKDVEVDGHRAMLVRTELDSLLSLVLPPLELTFDPVSKRLLEYVGIANVKDPATRKSYQVRIVFTYK